MTYDVATYEVCASFGKDYGLTEMEIDRLARHIQAEIESEIPWILRERTAGRWEGT